MKAAQTGAFAVLVCRGDFRRSRTGFCGVWGILCCRCLFSYWSEFGPSGRRDIGRGSTWIVVDDTPLRSGVRGIAIGGVYRGVVVGVRGYAHEIGHERWLLLGIHHTRMSP